MAGVTAKDFESIILSKSFISKILKKNKHVVENCLVSFDNQVYVIAEALDGANGFKLKCFRPSNVHDLRTILVDEVSDAPLVPQTAEKFVYELLYLIREKTMSVKSAEEELRLADKRDKEDVTELHDAGMNSVTSKLTDKIEREEDSLTFLTGIKSLTNSEDVPKTMDKAAEQSMKPSRTGRNAAASGVMDKGPTRIPRRHQNPYQHLTDSENVPKAIDKAVELSMKPPRTGRNAAVSGAMDKGPTRIPTRHQNPYQHLTDSEDVPKAIDKAVEQSMRPPRTARNAAASRTMDKDPTRRIPTRPQNPLQHLKAMVTLSNMK